MHTNPAKTEYVSAVIMEILAYDLARIGLLSPKLLPTRTEIAKLSPCDI